MITHLGHTHESGQDPYLFGLTQSHNHDGDSYHHNMFIWHAMLDVTSKDLSSSCQLEHKKIEISQAKSMWAGMRQTMSLSDKYYIHAIYSEEAMKDFYIKISPTTTNSTIKAIRINKYDGAIPVEAVWVGTKS